MVLPYILPPLKRIISPSELLPFLELGQEGTWWQKEERGIRSNQTQSPTAQGCQTTLKTMPVGFGWPF